MVHVHHSALDWTGLHEQDTVQLLVTWMQKPAWEFEPHALLDTLY